MGILKTFPLKKQNPYTYDEKEKLYALVVLKERWEKMLKLKSYFNSKIQITPIKNNSLALSKRRLVAFKKFKTLKK